MNRQRVISFVAVLCLAQLALITSHQLKQSDSDLYALRDRVYAAVTWVGILFSRGADTPSVSLPTSSPQIDSKTGSRSGELTPTLLTEDSSKPSDDKDILAKQITLKPRSSISETAQPVRADRDPFVPFFSIRDSKRSNTAAPLTEYDLSQLRVAAIIGDKAGNRSASVEASDGKSFIVKVGTKIGKNGGRVENISPTAILISEPTDSISDDASARMKELSLKTYPPPPSGYAE